MTSERTGYDRAVQSQISQYADVGEIHGLPEANDFVNKRTFESHLRDVFGRIDLIEIFAMELAEAVSRTGLRDVVSIGAGNGELEIKIVRCAHRMGGPPFRIICLELSPLLIARMLESARTAGVQDPIIAAEADLNQGLPLDNQVAAFFASHSLHHLVELELIFDQVSTMMHPDGAFVVDDMIGRNGHMRWPETLAIVRHIWAQLPDRLKWDRGFNRLDRWYENWDCSVEGFEGVRAQDILPLLLARFQFEKFAATHGITDVFVERRFGQNFDVTDAADVIFLDQLCRLQQDLVRRGYIKPVQMVAVLRKGLRPRIDVQCADGLTPHKALRLPHAPPPPLRASELERLWRNPYPPQLPAEFATLPVDEPIAFTAAGHAGPLVRWGWDEPGQDITWSLGAQSTIAFAIASPCSEIRLSYVPYSPPGGETIHLTVVVNGARRRAVMTEQHTCRVDLHDSPLQPGEPALIEFLVSRTRRPDIDGGDDKRPLGFGLVELELIGVTELMTLPVDQPIAFTATGHAGALVRWGWDEPGQDITWSLGAQSTIAFAVASPCSEIRLSCVPYSPPGGETNHLTVVVNGARRRAVMTEQHTCRVDLHDSPLQPGEPALIEFLVSRPRRPDIDGGDDKKPLGFGLVELELIGLTELMTLPVDEPIAFTATGHAGALVRWGWDEPGQDITWSLGAQSTIAFAVASPCSEIRLSCVPYSPPGGETNDLTVVVNGARRRAVMTEQHTCRVDLHDSPLQPGEPALIEFLVSRPRRPDIDGGDDKKPLGFGLVELELIGLTELMTLPVDEPIAFTATGHAGALVRWGWDEPGQDITWSLGAQSTIAFAVASPCSEIRLSCVPYSPPGGETNHLTVVVNGARRRAVMTEQHTCRVDLHDSPLQPGEPALIEFLVSRPRRPDIDGGDDKKPLGFGLVELELIGLTELMTLPVDEPIAFTATGHAGALVRWGWDEPGQDITWSLGAQSTIAFAVASPCSEIRLSCVPYSPPGGETNDLTVVVNGARRRAVMTEQHTCRVDLHDSPLQPGEPALIEFHVSRPRRPDIDGGDDKRPLGFALFELKLIGVPSV